MNLTGHSEELRPDARSNAIWWTISQLELRALTLLAIATFFVSAGLAWTCGSVFAAGTLPLLKTFGEQGTGAGQFQKPWGVAVDNSGDASKGDVYVVDNNNQRVQKFGAAGNFILMYGQGVNRNGSDVCRAGEECQAGMVGAGGGQFDEPLGVAVDPVSGSVYVTDVFNHRVQKFSSEGVFELMFGGNVNKNGSNVCKAAEECQAGTVATASEEGEGKFHNWNFGSFIAMGVTGTVYVGDENRVQEFNAGGEYQGQIKLSGFGVPTALAVNASGDVFVRAFEKPIVREYDPSGVELHAFALRTEGQGGRTIEAVGVDPVTNDLYVAEEDPPGSVISEYEGAGSYSLLAESSSSVLQSAHGVGLGRHGTVYASDFGLASGTDEVRVLGKPPTEGLEGAPAPVVRSPHVSLDGSRTAQLTATIDPSFQQATYYVQYGLDSSYSLGDVPAKPGLYLSGRLETPATVVVEGLQPDTEYHYRFVAESPSGTTYGTDATFVTDAEGITGLPDGRIYEQVSPAYKNGNFFDPPAGFMFGLAEAGGDSVVYPMSGAVGTSYAGMVDEYVSRRTPGAGWSTEQTTPRPLGAISIAANPNFMLPSTDFRKFLFADLYPFVEGDKEGFINVFLSGDPAQEPEWVSSPQIEHPIPALGTVVVPGDSQNYVIAGASPGLDRVYFGYAGTLLAEDAERAAHVGKGLSNGREVQVTEVDPWGFYEWGGGVLREAGVLPDGTVSPFGAVPATAGLNHNVNSRSESFQAGDFDNGVSLDGSRSFFVSPDPLASTVTDPEGCAHQPTNCTSAPPELYVREVSSDGSFKSTLVSASQLPGGEGVPAPGGVASIANVTYGGGQNAHGGGTFAFPSPDGSHAFFASVDRLTEAAPEDGALKEYDYDVHTGALTYLPGVQGSISAVGSSGATLMFVRTKEAPWRTSSEPWKLEVWRSGSGGGTVMPVATLPESESVNVETGAAIAKLEPNVRSAHISSDGNWFVFSTSAPIEGFNNKGIAAAPGQKQGSSALQVYRFDVRDTGKLDCLSCPPKGVTPVGDTYMSYNNFEEEELSRRTGSGGGNVAQTTQETRGMSANGNRVFFDTRSPLVAQATNGLRDVYEWEAAGEGSCARPAGCTFLISSGAASEDSYFLDSSESGGDAFFATSAGLVLGDTDEAYDIYDARIPQPGDTAPPSVPPCKGSVCQGPPSVPQLLSAPSSETFSGAGNPQPPPAAAKPVAKAPSRTQQLKRALRMCRKKRNKRKRAACERQARKRYGTKGSKSSRAAKASRSGGR